MKTNPTRPLPLRAARAFTGATLKIRRSVLARWIVVLGVILLAGRPQPAGAQDPGIHSPWRVARDVAFARAINPGDYECRSTAFSIWVQNEVYRVGSRDVLVLLEEGALDWAAYYSLIFDNTATGQYIGADGKYTREQLKRHKDNQRFWDVATDDIQLQGMHGNVIQNDALIVPTVKWATFFETGRLLSDDAVLAKVRRVQAVIERNPRLGYEHPFLSLNAFAVAGQPVPEVGVVIPDKLVMGDGILEVFESLGFGDIAPDYIHAHEFAHHVQFELGVYDTHQGTAEETRRTELMADGFAAYYCAHARGATFQFKRFVEVMEAAYELGDCAFGASNHHGTPNQREASAAWGTELARSLRARGHVDGAQSMLEFFDAVLPILVAPDRH